MGVAIVTGDPLGLDFGGVDLLTFRNLTDGRTLTRTRRHRTVGEHQVSPTG